VDRITTEFLTLPDRRLAYQRRYGKPGAPGLVFCSGYASNMSGTKAEFLDQRCSESGFSFLRFDYSGHGQSSGDFMDGTIGGWFEDACIVLDRLTAGPQIVIGSSMGGWIALMLAVKKPHLVRAFIGIAAAPDFTEEFFLPDLTPKEHAQFEQEGVLYRRASPPGDPLPITKNFVEEARKHLLLRSPLSVACPVRLLHGIQDEDIPWRHALRIAESVPHGDVRVSLVKDGGHRLSRPQDLALLWRTVGEFV
jgi:pimeloyl-ACP methyl ester carboxylesterase